MSQFVDEATRISGLTTTSAYAGGTVRFMCPELLEGGEKTTATDMWAFACLVGQGVEILTNQIPYESIKQKHAIPLAITRGELPMSNEDQKMDEDLWQCLAKCWKENPDDRPLLLELSSLLETLCLAEYWKRAFLSLPDAEDVGYDIYDAMTETYHSSLELALDEQEENNFELVDLTGYWRKQSEIPFASGNNTYVYRATLIPGLHHHPERSIVVKESRAIRIKHGDSPLKRRLLREALIWCQLDHKNIVPFLGLGFQVFGSNISLLCFISPWYENENVRDYLNRHPEINRSRLVGDSIEGVAYLHSRDPPVVHGNLKASNVLIDSNGRACIADFASSNTIQGMIYSAATTSSQGGGAALNRWMAPELVHEDNGKPTTASDIYSLGLLALEIYTGKIPFAHFSPLELLYALDKGSSPSRSHYEPFDPPKELWQVFERGWSFDPLLRPSAQEFRYTFHKVLKITGWDSV
ncbi:hypothetical protein FRC02_011916 [Tulasnella sp. 418]|nr:hypothetical protein FRC02_011916 [Tulasnella sp. 418]